MFAGATVGGSVIAEVEGDITDSSSITIEAVGRNLAQAYTLAGGFGVFGGAGSGVVAEITDTADVIASVAYTAELTTVNTLQVEATGDNDASASSDLASGGLVSLAGGELAARVGGAVIAEMDGDVNDANTLDVLATGNNYADADALTISLGLFAGAAASAVADITAEADVEAKVGSTAQLSVPAANIDVIASGYNKAEGVADSATLGLVSISVMLPDATVGGGVLAEFDGQIIDAAAGSLDVKATGQNIALATVTMGSVSLAGGNGAQANAIISSDADVEARVGSTADIWTSGAVKVQALLEGDQNKATANALSLAGGLFTASLVGAKAEIGGQ